MERPYSRLSQRIFDAALGTRHSALSTRYSVLSLLRQRDQHFQPEHAAAQVFGMDA
jgi:hypothetical protein